MKAIFVIYGIFTVLGLVGLYGWVWNIIKIINTHFAVIDGMLIARVIGVFLAPIGAILGFF